MTTILAKSSPRVTLSEHIEDCLLIHKYLEQYFPAAGKIIKDFDFWEILRLAVIFHDLGKGHKEFQNVLEGLKNDWKRQRHELFSLPFIEELPLEENVKTLLHLTVAGHHKDLETLLNDYIFSVYLPIVNNPLSKLALINFQKEFSKVRKGEIHDLLKNEYSITPKEVSYPSTFITIRKYAQNKLKLGDRDYFNLLLLHGALKNCDHLGSAQFKSLEHISAADMQYLNKLTPFAHQLACSHASGNVILISPTGSGKTESAMLWLRQQLTEHGQGRTFYVLPFTASINAMFERLRKEIGEEKIGMLHGKLADYLYEFFEENSEIEDPEALKKIQNKFKTIHTPLKIITPFQLLKHLFGIKGFEQGIFEMTGGHFIFDEIHAYSPDTFAQIKWLIEYLVTNLQARIFIMTATLPTFMREELETAMGKDNFTVIKAEESLYKQFNRHQLKLMSGRLTDEENIQEIIKSFDGKRKVLVVCNTVKSAQTIYQKLSKYVNSSVLLHGAFNGEDRSKHEKKLKEEVLLLVGTQAIEVSLDIDYDIIYTEPAPLDALIQRFGRINRRRKNSSCPVIVFDTPNDKDHYIYNTETVNRTLKILNSITNENEGIIQEARLQAYIDEVYPCWNPKEELIFDSTSASLKSLSISPLLYDKVSEEDFYSQFDGIKVLPEGLKDRFQEYLSNHDFIGAERLKVQIRKKRFAAIYKNKALLFPERYPLSGSKDVRYWLLRQKYDPFIGLIDDEQEVWHTEIF